MVSLATSETLPYLKKTLCYAPEDLWPSRPTLSSRERNSSFVILSPLAHIECQVLSRVSHNSSVTRIARSLLRGSPDRGLAIVALLSGCTNSHPNTNHKKILVQNLHMSSDFCLFCNMEDYDYVWSINKDNSVNFLQYVQIKTISIRSSLTS